MLKLWVHRIRTERTREWLWHHETSLEDSQGRAPASQATGRSWGSRRRGAGGRGPGPGWGSLMAAREVRGNSCLELGGSGEVQGGRGPYPGHPGIQDPRGKLTCHRPWSRGHQSWPCRALGLGNPRDPEGSHQVPCHKGPRGQRGIPCQGWGRRSSGPGRSRTASCWCACSCSSCSGTRPGWLACSVPCLWTTLQTPLVWALDSDQTRFSRVLIGVVLLLFWVLVFARSFSGHQ